MDNPFKFLTDDEWRALTAFAENRHFGKNDVLLAEGDMPGGLMVVRSGKVKVCREPAGFRIVVAEAGPGAIFGEMSFIEAEAADVSVIAAGEVDAMYVSHEQVAKALEKNPAMHGRFYQSLAWILSRRLRKTTGRVGNDLAESDWRD